MLDLNDNLEGLSATIIAAITQNLPSGVQEAARLFHGRGQCYGGCSWLTIDQFAPCLVLNCYDDAKLAIAEQIAQNLAKAFSERFPAIWLQRRGSKSSSQLILGDPVTSQEAVVRESGLNYRVEFGKNQNCGLFLDSKNLRAELKAVSQGKRVLNLFAYTCSYSVAAIAGGATEVINIDMAKGALARGRENHRLNNQDLKQVKFFGYDILKSLGRIKAMGPYDIVVIDPPTNQGRAFKASRDYHKIVRRLEDWVASGGIVYACHNDPGERDEFLSRCFLQEAPDFSFEARILLPREFREKHPAFGLKLTKWRRFAGC